MFLPSMLVCALRGIVPLAVGFTILAAFDGWLPTIQANARCRFLLAAVFRCRSILPIVEMAMYLRPGASWLSTENADRLWPECRLRLRQGWRLFAGAVLAN